MKHQPVPTWLDDSDHASSPTEPIINSANSQNSQETRFLESEEDPDKKKKVIKGILKFITMALCILMAVTAAFGLGNPYHHE